MKDKVRILIFLLLIYGITAASLLKKPKAFSENENRYLAEQPEFSAEALWKGTYTQEYETFITDQFIGRDQWISWKTEVERLMLRQDINGVYFCKDDYLMEKIGSDTFESEQAVKNVDSMVKFVQKFQDRFTADQMQVMLVPTASEVLKDKLPSFAAPYDQTAWMKGIGDKMPEGYLLDTIPVLASHSEEYIYYRTDHHWTAKGAFYAYQEWCKKKGLDAYKEDAFEIEQATAEFYGTLKSKVNSRVKPDSMYLYHFRDNGGYTLTYDRSEDVRNSLYDYSALETKDKYTAYLGGNYGEVVIDTGVKNGKTLLVIKDSFAHSFVPFTVNHYEKVLMVDLRYFNVAIEGYIEENEVTDLLVLYNLSNLATDKNVGKLMR